MPALVLNFDSQLFPLFRSGRTAQIHINSFWMAWQTWTIKLYTLVYKLVLKLCAALPSCHISKCNDQFHHNTEWSTAIGSHLGQPWFCHGLDHLRSTGIFEEKSVNIFFYSIFWRWIQMWRLPSWDFEFNGSNLHKSKIAAMSDQYII